MASIDVTVRGAGIFGLSVAFACVERGARVRVVDPVGVGAGASGGVVGALAPHTPENWNPKKDFQFESLIAAEPFWKRVDELSGRASGYARLGRLQPLADARALVLAREREAAATTLWRGLADWRVEKTDDAGWCPMSPTGMAVRDTLSARLHPRRACLSLAGAIEKLGGEVVVGQAEDNGAVIWAAGYRGLEDLGAMLGGQPGTGVKGQALLLHCDARRQPQIFADGLHIVPHADGTVAIGSTSERDFDDPASTDAQLEALHARAVAICPALDGARVVRRWAGVRPRARSRAPMLGQWPGRPGHFVANGGFKIGFGIAQGVGGLLADLVLDRENRIPPEFRVEASL